MLIKVAISCFVVFIMLYIISVISTKKVNKLKKQVNSRKEKSK